MKFKDYQQCNYCVMDTSDPDIIFNNDGRCNHCIDFDQRAKINWFPNKQGHEKISIILNKIKSLKKKSDYDCIIGLSGGIDSSYLAIKMYEFGLNPLVVHVDGGWNSELASNNIESIVKYCNYDLHTHVVDWNEMRDLQLAYLKSGISNQDAPQDHIFFSSIYHFATQNKIKYILSGGNFATEGIFPQNWHNEAMDAINLRAIHKKFGSQPLLKYKTISFFEYYFWYPFFKGLRTLRPLNYMNYNKIEALKELEKKINFKAYKNKHGESKFTKYFQNHYLPIKFGYDKRLPHLSTLIASGQISRDDAISQLKESLYDESELNKDILYICKKLKISREEYEALMKLPNRSYRDYPNWDFRYKIVKKIQSIYSKLTNKKLNVYS